MELTFILVAPRRAENVGAAARALKTMGFADLRLVGDPLHQEKSAQILAHGAADVLNDARCFPKLPAALTDVDLVVGATAKRRHQRRYHCSPQQLAHSLQAQHNSVNRAAIVFGCEPHGLANSDIAQCDILSQIPLAAPQPSLNLAQAVMIYCFALSSGQLQSTVQSADPSQLLALKARLGKLLDAADIGPTEKSRRWAMERLAQGHDEDVKFMHFICTKIESRLK